MLLTLGSRLPAALLAMAIEKLGYPVVSCLGWQAGFLIPPTRIQFSADQNAPTREDPQRAG